MALAPTRPQFGFCSGNKARRAGMGLVPICAFQASVLGVRPRLALKPTPSAVLRGGSAIIVVIPLAASCEDSPANLVPRNQIAPCSAKVSRCQYERTDSRDAAE
jgi:hypothetical protein